MKLHNNSTNMGVTTLSELLKFDKIEISSYFDIREEDIVDIHKINPIGIVTVELSDSDSCVIYDKSDLILSLLFSCRKSGVMTPDIEYCNILTDMNYNDLYLKTCDNIKTLSHAEIMNVKLIMIEVNEQNKVKFFN